MISVYNNGLKREVYMKKVLLMIAASLVMTSSAFAMGHAAGCPLKNLNKNQLRSDNSTNYNSFLASAQKSAPKYQGSGKSGAQQ